MTNDLMTRDLERIHEASMTLLVEVGIRFHHPKILEILEILEENGLRISGETAFFTEDQIMRWVGKAPTKR